MDETVSYSLTMWFQKASVPIQRGHGTCPTEEQTKAVQGFYFAKITTGEYTDNENSNKNNKDIYDQKRMCRTPDKTLCYRRGCL